MDKPRINHFATFIAPRVIGWDHIEGEYKPHGFNREAVKLRITPTRAWDENDARKIIGFDFDLSLSSSLREAELAPMALSNLSTTIEMVKETIAELTADDYAACRKMIEEHTAILKREAEEAREAREQERLEQERKERELRAAIQKVDPSFSPKEAEAKADALKLQRTHNSHRWDDVFMVLAAPQLKDNELKREYSILKVTKTSGGAVSFYHEKIHTQNSPAPYPLGLRRGTFTRISKAIAIEMIAEASKKHSFVIMRSKADHDAQALENRKADSTCTKIYDLDPSQQLREWIASTAKPIAENLRQQYIKDNEEFAKAQGEAA